MFRELNKIKIKMIASEQYKKKLKQKYFEKLKLYKTKMIA